jgi:hypothetical protein
MASFPLLLYTCNCTDFVPVAHIFVRSGAAVGCARGQRPLAERWRAMWPEFFPK